MKHKQRFLGILGFALILVLFGALLPQASAPEGNRLLVAYLLTWHAKARGSKYSQFPDRGDRTSKFTRHSADMSGSAIVRFQFEESTKRLWHYDTRYLSFMMTDNYDQWETYYRNPATASPGGDCSTHWSVDIPAESASGNSGFYMPPEGLENPLEKRADGVTVMPAAFNGYLRLTLVRFDSHNHISATQWTAPDKERALYWCTDPPERDWTNKQGGGDALLIHSLLSQKLDLQAVSRTDDSTFALNARFTVPDNIGSGSTEGAMIEVELTAEARRLGTCPCAVNSLNPLASGLAWNSSPATSPAFINYDDQGLKDGKAKEIVDVWPIDHEMDPNGSVPVQGGAAKIKGIGVKVRVTTCEGIPVKGETVQITVDPKRYSGGHDHHLIPVSRPGGKLNDKEIDKAYPDSGAFTCPCIEVTTDEKGYAYAASYSDVPAGTIRFQPPHVAISGARYGRYEVGVAGEYLITARSKQFPDSKASDSITAAVKGLTPMPADPNTYLLERGGIDTHPLGFHATAGTIEKFKELAAAFSQTQNNWNNQLKICGQKWHFHPASINDIALPTGGIFDWHQSWKPSHQTHNKGQGGDFNRFGDIKDDEPAFGCVPTPPLGGQTVIIAPLRSLLLHTLLELGKKYGHWDCSDLGADVPVGPEVPISSKQCQNGEFPDALFPFQANTTLHLHVED